MKKKGLQYSKKSNQSFYSVFDTIPNGVKLKLNLNQSKYSVNTSHDLPNTYSNSNSKRNNELRLMGKFMNAHNNVSELDKLLSFKTNRSKKRIVIPIIRKKSNSVFVGNEKFNLTKYNINEFKKKNIKKLIRITNSNFCINYISPIFWLFSRRKK